MEKPESDSATLCDGPPSTALIRTSSEVVAEIVESAECEDSGFSSLSDDEESIEDLIKLSSFKRLLAQTKMWFASEQSPVATEPPPSEPQPPSRIPGVVSGYVNPFSKKLSASVSLKAVPSVLGQMICNTKHVTVFPDKQPESHPDVFKFDTPSPDDVIKDRQRNLL